MLGFSKVFALTLLFVTAIAFYFKSFRVFVNLMLVVIVFRVIWRLMIR